MTTQDYQYAINIKNDNKASLNANPLTRKSVR